MKLSTLLFAAFLCVSLSSCGDDEECLDLSQSIIGEWESSLLGEGTIEFLADGTLIDENDLLIGVDSGTNQPDIKTYELEGNTILTVDARDDSSFASFDFNIASFECDKITFAEFFGSSVVLKRK